MSIFIEHFRRRTPKSKQLYQEARQYLAGGVGGHGKFLKPYPLYLKCAHGCRVVDVDDNEYLDVNMGAGPNLLGHNPTVVTDAVKRQLDVATHVFLATPLEVELAKRIQRCMPHLEMLRFANSGSEAARQTIKIARAYTGREKIAKFEGGFHGSDDSFLVSCMSPETRGPDSAPEPVLDYAGIPSVVLDQTLVLPFNDTDACVSLLRRHSQELAALILEPVAATPGGGVVIDKAFLEALRQETARAGILLIYDEIVTGFRLGLGGAAGWFGIAPDLAAIGKALAGGVPIAAFGGKREVMEAVVTPTGDATDHKTKIFQSGTFTGNPIAMAAGLAVLDELERANPYPHLDSLGNRVRADLPVVFGRYNIPIQISGIGSIFNFAIADHPVVTRRDVLRSNTVLQAEFCMGLIANGVLQPIRHAAFLSTAHKNEDIEEYLEKADYVLRTMKEAR